MTSREEFGNLAWRAGYASGRTGGYRSGWTQQSTELFAGGVAANAGTRLMEMVYGAIGWEAGMDNIMRSKKVQLANQQLLQGWIDMAASRLELGADAAAEFEKVGERFAEHVKTTMAFRRLRDFGLAGVDAGLWSRSEWMDMERSGEGADVMEEHNKRLEAAQSAIDAGVNAAVKKWAEWMTANFGVGSVESAMNEDVGFEGVGGDIGVIQDIVGDEGLPVFYGSYYEWASLEPEVRRYYSGYGGEVSEEGAVSEVDYGDAADYVDSLTPLEALLWEEEEFDRAPLLEDVFGYDSSRVSNNQTEEAGYEERKPEFEEGESMSARVFRGKDGKWRWSNSGKPVNAPRGRGYGGYRRRY